MAFTQKSSSVIQRVEGDLPPIPDTAGKDLKAWWSEATAVLDRVRDKIDDIESSTTTSTTTVITSTGEATYGTTFSNSDKSKLDGIETGATGDLSAEEIKALYESNGDTNAFTDAHLSNLQSLLNTDSSESSSSSNTTSNSNRQIARATSPVTSDRYLFTANTNQAQWIIDHQLGFLPNVQVYDSDLDEIEADIKHTDQYQTIINFTGTTTGYAVLS
jgi:hypothetical protein